MLFEVSRLTKIFSLYFKMNIFYKSDYYFLIMSVMLTFFIPVLYFTVDNDAVTSLLTNALKEDTTISSSTFAILAGTRLDNQHLTAILKSADVEVRYSLNKMQKDI